jgi:hypothetical protein
MNVKKAIILDSSKVYLKGTRLFEAEDQTIKEQEYKRQAYANRKATHGTKSLSFFFRFVNSCLGIVEVTHEIKD